MRITLSLFAFLVILRGCPSGGTGLDWDSRPYPDRVPEPVGCWTSDSISVYLDTTKCYGETTPDPISLQFAMCETQGHLEDIKVYARDIGLDIIQVDNPETADVAIHFYCQKWPRSTSACRQFTDDFRTGAKITSSTAPAAGTSYNGIVYANVKNRVMRGAECHLNVYTIEQLRADYAAAGRTDWPIAARKVWDIINWHEGGHWWGGLNDDRTGTTPGMMVYRALQPRPNQYERANLEFMYE